MSLRSEAFLYFVGGLVFFAAAFGLAIFAFIIVDELDIGLDIFSKNISFRLKTSLIQGGHPAWALGWCDAENTASGGSETFRPGAGYIRNKRICANHMEYTAHKERRDGKRDCKDRSDEGNDECRSATHLLPCHGNEFRCGNGRCIPGAWVCDGIKDCDDGTNETLADCSVSKKIDKTGGGYMAELGTVEISTTASSAQCPSTDFACANGECIPRSWRCDQGADYADGSDEHNCPGAWTLPPNSAALHAVSALTCAHDQFHCDAPNGTAVCLPLSKVCDHHNDCKNGTDEGFGCKLAEKECEKNNGQCSHKCNLTPAGRKCSCPHGYVLYPDGRACADIDECATSGSQLGGTCSQLCINLKGTYKCHCAPGFLLEFDGHTCKSVHHVPLLMYSTDGEIRYMETEGFRHNDRFTGGKLTSMTVGLDWKQNNGFESSTMFYSDADRKHIIRYESTHERSVVLKNMVMPESIASDWVSENLYYVDAGKPEIGVCSVSRKAAHCAPVIDAEIDNPRGLAVHPGKRLLSFAQWGSQPKIERSWLDGSARVVVVSHKVLWPNALVIDYIWDRLYFIDAQLDWTESVSYSGDDRRTVFRMASSHPFGLTMIGNRLYWTEWTHRGIYSVLTNGSNFQLVYDMSMRPLGIVAVHPLRQPHFDSPCEPAVSLCDQICLARVAHYYTCVCQRGYRLVNDTKCVLLDDHIQREALVAPNQGKYSSSTVAEIICACILCGIVIAVAVIISRKHLRRAEYGDEKSLLFDYDVESLRPKARRQPSCITGSQTNPCYENIPHPGYVVKFHKDRNVTYPHALESPAVSLLVYFQSTVSVL
ncbi:low-density lipoprotein receptor-related protein 2-like isoform X2 [Paramacrobiotus metropolitanus]|uniref:low-density lipoprotein receptor-related protein 2-like isoform X2 n=1 Tax=Paramacrobiotus metropolitanus TaxID=2943436 RepID=UPI002445BBC5|nr:low-density lipoprotein receptor-related protein 2-like isoform X2 [Paramacrobiotus metropolitanus]